MSDKKKETEKTWSPGLWGLKPEQWVTQAELRALSGHGQHAFISTRPRKSASESDSEKTDSDEKASDS